MTSASLLAVSAPILSQAQCFRAALGGPIDTNDALLLDAAKGIGVVVGGIAAGAQTNRLLFASNPKGAFGP